MKEGGIKVALSDGNSILKEWEQPCQLNLPEVYEAVKQVKQSVNDYLTQLIDQEKSSTVKDQKEPFDVSDGEENIDGDSITGFINDLAMVSETQKNSKKRKANSNQERKRRK